MMEGWEKVGGKEMRKGLVLRGSARLEEKNDYLQTNFDECDQPHPSSRRKQTQAYLYSPGGHSSHSSPAMANVHRSPTSLL